ncbi:NADH-dependent flavin oxidoreductase [Bacillus sp. GM2]|uniref:NADH-dependent flavin oxidoreductase n=1 Tax=Bacillus TaxID=1386 RepID=UPI00095181DA|nr:NADH-dependent flavin oxidoreductase [Bacillus paralicheniformis]MSN98904.1 NADH-dependent flavin oxidoreductase [Bacillus paralicheniformis]MSO02912.1 NADH-dependent flavin oxidoreductase [Bacillus paralicheniformis]MSO06905.1 NADH-dependent flavin oxidoreductase [Bacillus paralicheniformis]MSO10899.1 NADH-dependent flavin oxidoreductase [Bacillus paralicheniformis]NJE36016.1 NADH-dependent flavin oxidoreductase [Bacillus paralicheniformis]
MKKQYDSLFTPFTFKNGIQLKNRIIMPPMGHSSSMPGGFISDDELVYYAARATDVGMVITSATTVQPGTGFPGIPGAENDDQIPGLTRLAATLKKHGAKAILQLFHSGAKGIERTVSASAVAPNQPNAPVPRALSDQEIQDLIHSFGQAARRAIEAGFDGVEIHGANGFLIHQFFSPYYNRRNDSWGGTLEKRMRFPLQIIEEIRRVAESCHKPSFIIGYKFSPEEPETPGITMAETLAFVNVLREQTLDYLHVSLIDFRSLPRRGADKSRTRMELIKEAVGDRLPLIGAGKVRTPEDAVQALKTGADLVGIGRGLLMDPEWLQKVQAGKEDDIQTTLSRHDQQKLAIPDAFWESIPMYIDFND